MSGLNEHIDMEKLKKIFLNIDRISNSGQELARTYMDKETSQKSQNSLWRYLKQDIRDMKKILGLD